MFNISNFNDDLFELEDFSIKLEKYIEIERLFVSGSLVITLSSPYGYGKSTFLKMWSNHLAAQNDSPHPMVIFLDAWESDYYGDPLFSLVSATIENIRQKSRLSEKITEAAKDIGWFSTTIAAQIAKQLTGIDPIGAGKIATEKKIKRQKTPSVLPSDFDIYRNRKHSMHALKEALSEYIKSTERGIIFLIDDLDRCRPDYAISYLETIKHIFDIEGATFILAIDRSHLENSAKTAFGSMLKFDEYYRKFSHREISLPKISKSSYQKLARKYVDHYLTANGGRNCVMEITGDIIENTTELISALELNPRQLQESFRILGHLLSSTKNTWGKLTPCNSMGSILLASLRVYNKEIYEQLGNGKWDASAALNFFFDKLTVTQAERWLAIILTGGGLTNYDREENPIHKELTYSSISSKELHNLRLDWRSSEGIIRLYKMIENIENF